MDTTLTSAGLSPSTDPQPDQAAPLMPERIAQVLTVLFILIDHAHTLLELLEQGTAMRGFTLIARCFGTTKVPVIVAAIRRGLRRAVALRQVLQDCAADGGDIRLPRKRTPRARKAAWQDPTAAGNAASGDGASGDPASGDAFASDSTSGGPASANTAFGTAAWGD